MLWCGGKKSVWTVFSRSSATQCMTSKESTYFLDRCESQRKDMQWIEKQFCRPDAKLLLISGEKVAVVPKQKKPSSQHVSSAEAKLHFETPSLYFKMPPLVSPSSSTNQSKNVMPSSMADGCYFLGMEVQWNGSKAITSFSRPDAAAPLFGVPIFAADSKTSFPPSIFMSLDPSSTTTQQTMDEEKKNIIEGTIENERKSHFKFVHLRSVAVLFTPHEASLVAQAKSLIEWHSTSKYCGKCGNLTSSADGGLSRKCLQCFHQNFPRTNPVAIMLVIHPDGEHILLGQSRGRMKNMKLYSVLAGFIDQGESLEDAVRREVYEESGIVVGEVMYYASQPWPFPHNLMLGCFAQGLTQRIHMEEEEMVDVQWFNRSEVEQALHDADQFNLDAKYLLPPKLAIAHHLIRCWAEGSVKLKPSRSGSSKI